MRTPFLARCLDAWRTQDCLLCGASDAQTIFCATCITTLPRHTASACPRCAVWTPHSELCGACLRKAPHYDATYAVYHYAFPLDQLIQSFKYGHRIVLADYFGEQLANCAADLSADRIIPLPLHRTRLQERGFNQAQELAKHVAKRLHCPLDTYSCQRQQATAVQAGLHWKERAQNVRGAFACRNELSGQRILLIDDVMTSGATLNECARTLKLHGASEVNVLVLARAQRHTPNS